MLLLLQRKTRCWFHIQASKKRKNEWDLIERRFKLGQWYNVSLYGCGKKKGDSVNYNKFRTLTASKIWARADACKQSSQRWAQSRIRSESGVRLHFWIRSRTRIGVFELKPDSEPDPDFGLCMGPRCCVFLLLGMIEKCNILVLGWGWNPDPERIQILRFVDKQDPERIRSFKSLNPERIRSQFFVTPLISKSSYLLAVYCLLCSKSP